MWIKKVVYEIPDRLVQQCTPGKKKLDLDLFFITSQFCHKLPRLTFNTSTVLVSNCTNVHEEVLILTQTARWHAHVWHFWLCGSFSSCQQESSRSQLEKHRGHHLPRKTTPEAKKNTPCCCAQKPHHATLHSSNTYKVKVQRTKLNLNRQKNCCQCSEIRYFTFLI